MQKEIDDRVRNATRGISSLVVQNIINSLLGFVFLGALLRLLPPIDYGGYSAVQVTVGIASPVAMVGLSAAATRFVSLKREEGRENWIQAARSVLVLSLVTVTIATVIFVLLAPYLSLYYMRSTNFSDIFELGSLWLFSISIATIFQGLIQGLKQYSTLAKMLVSSRAAMVVITIIALLLVPNVLISIGAWVIYSAIIVAWTLKILGKEFFRMPKDAGASVNEDKHYSDILRYAIPLGVASVFVYISSYADVVILGGYLGPISLGIYNVAVTVSLILSLVLILPLQTLILPEVSSNIGNEQKISNVLRLSFRFVMLVLFPASLFLAGMPAQFISLFSGGGGYLAGSFPLLLIASFYVLDGIQIAIYFVLQAIGKTTQVLIIAAFTAGIDVIFALILVPQFGLVGAAITKDLVAVLGLVLTIYLGRTYLNGLDKFAFYAKSIVPAAGVFGLTYVLSTFVANRALTLIPYSLGALLVFLLLIKALNLLNEEDEYFLSHIVPKSLRKLFFLFVKNENTKR